MNSTSPKTIYSPLSLGLLSYQAAFAANNTRFKIGLWSRQTGKDYTATAEAVLDCYHHPATTWIILAASERQALESLAKAKEWADVLKFQIHEYSEAPANLPASVARAATTEIKWSNGSRLIALPASPATIRGYSANLILTEFAFHENADAIWRAIYPTISNPLRGGIKKLRIISTPNGLNNKFAHLWLNTPGTGSHHGGTEKNVNLSSANSAPLCELCVTPSLYHKSKITIHDATAAGLPLNPAELQAGLNDPDAWSQEYLCDFADNSTVLLPYDLIESCESEFASELSSPQALSASALPAGPAPQLFAGIDFGRKHHLTVCWILESVPANSNFAPRTSHLLVTREVLCLRNLSTPDQVQALLPRLKLCQRVCLDYTGPGIGLGDYLAREFNPHSAIGNPQSRLELCPFTSAFKAELFPRLAAAFESRQLLIPIGRDIREDLHSIYRTTTNSGAVLYRAHSTPDGHADRTTALALALRAAQTAPVTSAVHTIGTGFRDRRYNTRFRYAPPEQTIAIIY